jgi:hypothetical protein
MMLGGFFRVMFRLYVMAVGEMSVMASLLMFARLMLVGGIAVVLGSVFVVCRCVTVMFGALFRHGDPFV